MAGSSVVRERKERVTVKRSEPVLLANSANHNGNYNQRLLPTILALPAIQSPWGKFPKVNQDIELFDQDRGGCWFRCKVLFASKTRLKVQHKDVLQADGAGNLKEWVPAGKKVDSDKLEMRSEGRLTVRPQRYVHSTYNTTFAVGAAVDVWRCNSWWEAVVTGYETLTNLQVYFPGENRLSTAARKDMRVSKDWLNSNWVDVRPVEDIMSRLSSILIPGPEPIPHPVLTQANSSATDSEDPSPRTLEEAEEVDKWKVPAESSTASTSLNSAERLNLKKRLIRRYNEDIKYVVDAQDLQATFFN